MNMKTTFNFQPATWQQQVANPFATHHPEATAYEGRYAEPVASQVIDTIAEVVSSEPVPASLGNPVLVRSTEDHADAQPLGLLPRAAVAAGGALMLAGCKGDMWNTAVRMWKEYPGGKPMLLAGVVCVWMVGAVATGGFSTRANIAGAAAWPVYLPARGVLWAYGRGRKQFRLSAARDLSYLAKDTGGRLCGARLMHKLSVLGKIASQLNHSVPYIRKAAVRAMRRAIINFEWDEEIPDVIPEHVKKLIVMMYDPEELVRTEARKSVVKIISEKKFFASHYAEFMRVIAERVLLIPEGVPDEAKIVGKLAKRSCEEADFFRYAGQGIERLANRGDSDSFLRAAKMFQAAAPYMDPGSAAHQAQRIVPLLLDKRVDVRRAALRALGAAAGRAEDSETRNDLVRAIAERLGDREGLVRQAAAIAIFEILAQNGEVDDDVIEGAVATLGDGQSAVRSWVRTELAGLYERFNKVTELRIRKQLKQMMYDPREYVRLSAMEMIVLIKSKKLGLDGYLDICKAIIDFTVREKTDVSDLLSQFVRSAVDVLDEEDRRRLYYYAQDTYRSEQTAIPAEFVGLLN